MNPNQLGSGEESRSAVEAESPVLPRSMTAFFQHAREARRAIAGPVVAALEQEAMARPTGRETRVRELRERLARAGAGAPS